MTVLLFKELASLSLNFSSEITFLENRHKGVFVPQESLSHIPLIRSEDTVVGTFSRPQANILSHHHDYCSLC